MNHIVRLAPLLLGPDDVKILDEDLLVSNIKVNVLRYQDSKALSTFEKLSDVIRYFQRKYLQNPNSSLNPFMSSLNFGMPKKL